MSFDVELRGKIAKSKIGTTERNILKVVLGELQQEMNLTDEKAYAIVKKLIKDNNINISHLSAEDSRRKKFEDENLILSDLLPNYMSLNEVKTALSTIDLTVCQNDNHAMGMAVKHLKSINALFENETVKQAVAEIRKKK